MVHPSPDAQEVAAPPAQHGWSALPHALHDPPTPITAPAQASPV
jgi:hypothetical protein